MASDELTGWLEEEYLAEQAEFGGHNGYSFTEWHCLAQIPKQPDDYDGPPRYCKNPTQPKENEAENGRGKRCRHHNGWMGTDSMEAGIAAGEETTFEENNAAALKHGMYAEDENLKENFSEADEALFDQIMMWAEEYGFEDGSPAFTVLESMALSKVREMRAEKYLNENGEVVERQAFDPETGNVEEWEEVHPLSDAVRLKKKTILSMMKELGLTPKAKSRMGESEAKATASEAIGKMAADALDSDDEEYDPSEFTDG